MKSENDIMQHLLETYCRRYGLTLEAHAARIDERKSSYVDADMLAIVDRITDAQLIALRIVFDRFKNIGAIYSAPFNDPALMVEAGNMTLGIEADGYTHS